MNTETAVLDLASEATLKKESSILETVQKWEVKDAETYSALDAYLVSIKEFEKMVEADFSKSEGKARDAKREATASLAAIVEQKESHLNKAIEARRLGKNKLVAYEETQKREQERLQREADAKAKKEAEDRAVKEAAELEKAGDKEAAAAVIAAPVYVPPVRIASMVPERATTVQTRWSATVNDPAFVLKSVRAALSLLSKAKTPAGIKAYEDLAQAEKDLGFMEYNQTTLNGVAKAGSPYVNGVLKLGGVSFSSRKV